MKKTKRFGKAQVTLAVMIVALAAAVGLNMKYSAEQNGTSKDNSSKFLGQAEYVNATVSDESDDKTQTTESEYFKNLREQMQNSRKETLEILEETLDRTDLTDAQREETIIKSNALAEAVRQEAAIETILKTKGFKNVLVIIGEKDVNVIVDGKQDAASAAKIQDAVISQTAFSVSDIKIIFADENS